MPYYYDATYRLIVLFDPTSICRRLLPVARLIWISSSVSFPSASRDGNGSAAIGSNLSRSLPETLVCINPSQCQSYLKTIPALWPMVTTLSKLLAAVCNIATWPASALYLRNARRPSRFLLVPTFEGRTSYLAMLSFQLATEANTFRYKAHIKTRWQICVYTGRG